MTTQFSTKMFGAWCLLVFLLTSSTAAQDVTEMTRDQGRVRAPELNGHQGWLNTEKPLTLAELRGKVVLLDFWTYGCINCIHIIPDLKKLEAKYPNELVVIGVHSAKFENERESENIRRIVLRYELEHPIVNDAEYKIWDAYAVKAWPTQTLIDPDGYVVTQTTGEGQLELLDKKIGETVQRFKETGKLNTTPIKFALEKEKFANTPLRFPGKILADAKTNRLYISDSNHNRIVVTKLDGTLVDIIGSGAAGMSDGDFKTARFHRLQGLALDGTSLYVADTENHTIRLVDLAAKTVETVAGVGRQGGGDGTEATARETALNSPWDLQLVGRDLYIAMAGNHQIWRMNLTKKTVARFAGSGREARVDGGLEESAFSQPSGLAFDGKTLYVADSEANIIRAIDLTKKTVTTVAGGDLFDFGDVDGKGDAVRLQHPLGVVVSGKNILIADTYNHKIKQLSPITKTVTTLFGSGTSELKDGAAKAAFYEPGGLSVAAGKLYIADTNNQAVRVINLQTKQVSTLKIAGLQPPPTTNSPQNVTPTTGQ